MGVGERNESLKPPLTPELELENNVGDMVADERLLLYASYIPMLLLVDETALAETLPPEEEAGGRRCCSCFSSSLAMLLRPYMICF